MKIVICGSMTFAQEMDTTRKNLQERGFDVFVSRNIKDFLKGAVSQEKKELKIALNVFRDYFNEIKNADAILVLNYEKKSIPNYIGANALIEMAFAHVLGKRIFLLNPCPTMDYSDEIEALQPTILNGNLSLIN